MYKSLLKIIILLIILVISIIYIFIYRGKEIIINNWSDYRCSPFIIPIAGLFGKNTSANAQKCFFKTFKYFFDFLIKPCQFIIKIIQTILGKLFYDINAFRTFLKPIRMFIMKATQDFYDKVNNFSNSIVYSFAKSRNILKRMAGIFRLTLYSLEVVQFSMKSIWDGPIGKVARKWPPKFGKIKKFFCFHPNTRIKIKDTIISLNDIKITSQIGENNFLEGKFTCYVENIKLYLFNGDWVTGGHLVYLDKWIYIKDIPSLNFTRYSGPVICPITTNGIFYTINNNLYRDFEENQQIDKLFFRQTINHLGIHLNPNKYIGNCIGLYENSIYYDEFLKKKIKINSIKIGDLINRKKVLGIYKIVNNDKFSFRFKNLIIGSRQIIYDKNWSLVNNFTPTQTHTKSIFYSFITEDRYYNINGISFLDLFDGENINKIRLKDKIFQKWLNIDKDKKIEIS